ncbi:hypothetical protein J2N86_13345 [Legionella lytica]|uniref:Ankyrin repeats (3 copies) n=1 Tax=Legionella lytica TaxID=96232 RepID=A0ABY4Y7U5_9GAMM|nr:ankyrin repeat domain-containing protein [Legionella lytica]USQ13645.1 hypothetical protein J2N86_13345 [Legionella lytica]
MGQSKSLESLFVAINEYHGSKNKTKKLKEIKSKAENVIKKYNTLDLAYRDPVTFLPVNLLQAAMVSSDVFKLLVGLGANPFFNGKSERDSPINLLAYKYFPGYCNVEERVIFEWLMTDKESPVFTWSKLAEKESLFNAFVTAGLVPREWQIDELPIHVAIQAGRLDLVQEVLKAAGSMQAAGDINQMSILSSAIRAVCLGKENAIEIFLYLLREGASTQLSNGLKLPPIIQLLTERVFLQSKVEEKLVFNMVKWLLEHDARLDVTNPNDGSTPLMTAMSMGYHSVFDLFLETADAATLNHRATSKPNYLLFQFFDENRLVDLDILKLLPELKSKGLEFDKTINYSSPADPFNNRLYGERREIFASHMSLLHFYVDNLTHNNRDDFFPLLDKRLEVIQALIAHGIDPKATATFTYTKNERVEGAYETKKVKISRELTAAEYLRQIADKVISHDSDAYLIKTYRDENEFLQHIEIRSRNEQIKLHKQFHQFRNLERVLSGEKPLVYSGLPDVRKMEQLALKSQGSQDGFVSGLDPNTVKNRLLDARESKDHEDWKELKKAMVDYVKQAESLQDFLERVEQFKQPLQLHFDVNRDANGEVVSYGSLSYRFFHYFDPHKFPSSWESLRAFGQTTYGVDINTEYDQPVIPKFE